LSPDKNLNAEQQKLIGEYYHLTNLEKIEVEKKFSKPTVSDFLLPLVEGKVTQIPNSFIESIQVENDTKLNITTNLQKHLTVDHVIAATGFRFSARKLDFLSPIISKIQMNQFGEPIVNEYFQSSEPNLYFVGPATAYCHGPPFRFIAGVWNSAEVVMKHVNNTLIKQNISLKN